MEDIPKTNKQHAVPQNIMDVEFKLIGDLTMRQFSYLLICGILAYVNSQVMVGLFKWPLTLIFALLGLALAFVPIEDRGMDQWIINFIKSVYAPTQRIWKKKIEIPSAFLYESMNVVKQELITLAPTSSRRKLEEYLEYQSKVQPVDPLDIPEAEYILKVRQAFKGVVTAAQMTRVTEQLQAMPVAAAVQTEVVTEEVQAPVQAPTIEAPPTETPTKVSPRPLPEAPTETPTEVVPPTAAEPTIVQTETTLTKGEAPSAVATKPSVTKDLTAKEFQKPEIPTEAPKETAKPKTKEENLVEEAESLILDLPNRSLDEHVMLTPMTPDRHSGRRFTSFLPSQGELMLPIRGEKILKTTEQIEIEEDIKGKAEKLQQLLEQIRGGNQNIGGVAKGISGGIAPMAGVVPREVSTGPAKGPTMGVPGATDRLENLSTENINMDEVRRKITEFNKRNMEIDQEIERVKKTPEALNRDSLIKQLEERKNNVLRQREVLLKIAEAALAQPAAPQSQGAPSALATAAASAAGAATPQAPGRTVRSAQSVMSRVPIVNQKPNVIVGLVKDPMEKPLDSIVLIIKNARGEPVRAMKTNSLGQFTLATPLANGSYTIEVSPSTNKTNLTFDIISLEAGGQIIPPIELVGK